MKFCKLHPCMFIGLKAGIVDQEHYENMGKALWLFLWCIMRQTGQGKEGAVCRGAVITYEQISEETGFHMRNVRRWMKILEDEMYVRMEHEQRGFRLWIEHPAKFRVAKSGHADPAVGGQKWPVRVANNGQSEGTHLVESIGTSEKLLQNNLTRLEHRTDNKDAAVAVKILAREKQMPKPKPWEQQKAELRERGYR